MRCHPLLHGLVCFPGKSRRVLGSVALGCSVWDCPRLTWMSLSVPPLACQEGQSLATGHGPEARGRELRNLPGRGRCLVRPGEGCCSALGALRPRHLLPPFTLSPRLFVAAHGLQGRDWHRGREHLRQQRVLAPRGRGGCIFAKDVGGETSGNAERGRCLLRESL